jgi:hypothetical protein
VTARACIALLLLAGCGATPPSGPGTGRVELACNERRAEYVVAGGFAALEVGVVIECTDAGATLARWRRTEPEGEPGRTTKRLAAGEFEELWSKVESTGWRNLEDCDNPAAAPGDPLYTFYISDHISRVSFTCVGKSLPFPYDRIVTEFDLAAAAAFRD